MKQTSILLYGTTLRWGNVALMAALMGSLGIVGLVTWNAPDLTIFLPVVLLALSAGVILFTKPRFNFIVWLGAFALLFSSEKGIQLHEVVYGLYFYTYLAHWYIRRLFLYNRPIVHGRTDIAFGLWLGLGLSLGVGLSLLFGADLTRIRSTRIAARCGANADGLQKLGREGRFRFLETDRLRVGDVVAHHVDRGFGRL